MCTNTRMKTIGNYKFVLKQNFEPNYTNHWINLIPHIKFCSTTMYCKKFCFSIHIEQNQQGGSIACSTNVDILFQEQRAIAVSCSWAACKQRSARNRKRPRPIDANESAAAESHPSESENDGGSTRHISNTMSNFCDGKRKAVTEIGFGGVLHMPMNGNANLRHAVSLLSRVDLNSGTLPVGKDVRVQMSPEHIERLIGTPSRGRRVCGLDPDTPEERTDFVRLAMGSQRFYNDGLKAAELVVRREWDGSVTAERVEEFKVAFVVWIVGRFLAPSTKHDDHGCSDFWGSLYNANEIREYNWSAYFLAHIMGAAARVQSDIKNKRATTAMLISGCPLLLQLYDLYLRPLRKPQLVSPRVKDYDSKTLVNKMISADTLPKISAQGEPSFGACGPRCREESCYMTMDPGQPSSSHVLRPGQGAPETPRVQVTNQVPPILQPYNAYDFCGFLKGRYPDMMDSELVDHLKFHNARCILHSSIFKNSIITENMKLAAKILDTQRQRKKQAPARARVLEDYFTASDSETEAENKRARTHEKSKLPPLCRHVVQRLHLLQPLHRRPRGNPRHQRPCTRSRRPRRLQLHVLHVKDVLHAALPREQPRGSRGWHR
nr:uncharacterized protein LOC120968355 [Aegilops tauschii subsp. strangulata]